MSNPHADLSLLPVCRHIHKGQHQTKFVVIVQEVVLHYRTLQ